MIDFEKDLDFVLSEIATMLLAKNKAYGNSALEPKRIFSKASSIEQINVRIDDKLSRIAMGTKDTEDSEMDLLGYLILKRIAIEGGDLVDNKEGATLHSTETK